jgi:hypothetical protein
MKPALIPYSAGYTAPESTGKTGNVGMPARSMAETHSHYPQAVDNRVHPVEERW